MMPSCIRVGPDGLPVVVVELLGEVVVSANALPLSMGAVCLANPEVACAILADGRVPFKEGVQGYAGAVCDGLARLTTGNDMPNIAICRLTRVCGRGGMGLATVGRLSDSGCRHQAPGTTVALANLEHTGRVRDVCLERVPSSKAVEIDIVHGCCNFTVAVPETKFVRVVLVFLTQKVESAIVPDTRGHRGLRRP